MKKILSVVCCMLSVFATNAQLTMPANGGSVKATIGETIGITDVKISYGRPGLRGRDGKVWGSVVHEGFMADASFGKPRNIPWRAGANENTIIEFSTDVMVEGKPLKAGKYGLHIAYGADNSIVIFSNSTEGWGSYFYDANEDALRVNVKPVSEQYTTERLTYSFRNQTDSSAEIALTWDKLSIPFTVSTQLQKLQLASIEREMNGQKTFNPNAYFEAAGYYLDNNIMLDKALEYARQGSRIVPTFFGINLQRRVLLQLNRKREADSLMAASVIRFSMAEMNSYGRTLLREKEMKKAREIFELNYKKNPDNFVTLVGMMRGCSAVGDYKKALSFCDKAKAKAPDDNSRKAIERMTAMLKENKDINS
ncbi:hypothetical protein CAP35_06675 [Chitinophagaceae bacterium IBVUCB1]|nr:hypothetical protein CAP35_06675 [Chitinophagaceae bacterium IBVUCB1]